MKLKDIVDNETKDLMKLFKEFKKLKESEVELSIVEKVEEDMMFLKSYDIGGKMMYKVIKKV